LIKELGRKKRSTEARARMSESAKRRERSPPSAETIEKIRLSNIGKKRSPETCERIKAAQRARAIAVANR
jgi:hypothetical protein